ncbi:MAG: protein kinase [Thermoanaerobaculia bacterium]
MSLPPGTRLGAYEITAPLGEGGMGVVYRATDSKLKREVAIKVLPEAFAADVDRLARFEREAQVLAQLQHPNIASIYGLEESGGIRALVMELVEGEDLAGRLKRGPLPLDEALSVARQIAEALEAAHEKGIVHRDLKPANVKLTREGAVKVLDFGLAKAMDTPGTSSAADLGRSPTLMNSPTMTAAHGTQLGVILGTAAYMSPEQARGQAVDKRADIWAFGVVLHEMLSGRSLFAADTVSDTLAGVLKNEIDLAKLPAGTPASVRRLLRHCLERNPKDRLHDIADARIELLEATGRAGDPSLERSAPESPPLRGPSWRSPLFAAVTLALGLATGWLVRPAPARPPLVRAAINAPEGTELVPAGDAAGPVAISPDGSQLAFTARDGGGVTRLYVQSLAAGKARVIPSSEGARYPFWSPDSRSLGFFNSDQLLRVDTAEGAPLALAPANAARGGSWGTSGVIVYAPSFDTALLQVPARGGPPAPASVLDGRRLEGTNRFPSFLPDGRHFLFEARGYSSWMRASDGVFVGSLDDPERRVPLLPHASNAMYAAGRLLFVHHGDLCAQRFDPERLALSGPVSILVRDVRFDRRYSLGVFSATAGVLALQQGAGQDASELVWLDRTGRRLERLGGAANHDGVNLSPDGSQVLVSMFDPAISRSHLEVLDLARRTSTRLTFGEADDYGAIWSPDGTRVLFARVSDRGIGLWVKPADGSAAEQPFRPERKDELLFPLAWSPDGSRVLFGSLPGGSLPTGFWTLPSSGEGAPERYTDSRGNGDIGLFSPDGRWVVFDANEGKGSRTFLARFPDTGGRWQFSEDSAGYSRWTRGGREIVYLASDSAQVTALPVDLSGKAPRFGAPARLFAVPMLSIAGNTFDVTADGNRFLFVLPVPDARPTPYTLILGWERLLEQER